MICLHQQNILNLSRSSQLERQFESELDQTPVVHGGINDPEGRRGIYIRVGCEELRMIEEIEELRPEIKPHTFAPRHWKMFDG
jgi:hypothetical protein